MLAENTNPYAGMKVVLRRDGPNAWMLMAILDDKIVSAASLIADEATAMSRAHTLAGWFDAELILQRVGLA